MNYKGHRSYLPESGKTLKSILRANMVYIAEIIAKTKRYDLGDTVVVAGTPRSGTTWLAEVLSAKSGYTVIFEPLHPIWFPEAVRSGFKARTYAPPGKTWISGEKYLERVLSGKVVSARFEGVEKYRNSFLSHKLIVKFVRANRLLPWLSENFEVRKIILLVRHPCAVVASQLQSGYYGYNDILLGRDIRPKKEEIINEAAAIGSIDQNIIKKIERVETPEELLATLWCLDNYVPLHSTQKNRWLLVPYEKLMMEKSKSVKYIADMCGIVCSKQIIKHINKPSRVASPDLRSETNQQLSKWKNQLSNEQIAKIINIVNAFGLDFYSNKITPDYKCLDNFGTMIK